MSERESERSAWVDPPGSRTTAGADITSRMAGLEPRIEMRETDRRHGVLAPKTSGPAALGLAAGVAALVCALSLVLATAAVPLGIVGGVLSGIGLAVARRPGVTGTWVAVGGLVTALLGVALAIAVLVGVDVGLNGDVPLDGLQEQLDDVRSDRAA